MPYLQVDLDGKKLFANVGRAAGISTADVALGLLDLWEWCWLQKTCSCSVDHLAGFFGCEGARVGRALRTFGFAEELSDGVFRVRGAAARLRVSRAQSEAGKRNAGNLRRGSKPLRVESEVGSENTSGSAPALTPSTQHPTPNKGEEALSAAPTGPDPAELQKLWNETAHPSLPRCSKITDARRPKAKARLAERDLAGWREVIGRIARTPFCLGENDRGWVADFDWLLKSDTATKVLEGKYDRGKGPAPNIRKGVVTATDAEFAASAASTEPHPF